MENVITLGKVIGLFLFCPLSSLFRTPKNARNELARPVMGNIVLSSRPSLTYLITHDKTNKNVKLKSYYCQCNDIRLTYVEKTT